MERQDIQSVFFHSQKAALGSHSFYLAMEKKEFILKKVSCMDLIDFEGMGQG